MDAIKGIEAVKAASGELAFRDAMLNEFLGVSRKMFRANFILMVVRQRAADDRSASRRPFSSGSARPVSCRDS